MRKNKTASAPKAQAARSSKTVRSAERKATTVRRAAATKAAAPINVTKATKSTARSQAVKPVENLVAKVKDGAVKAKTAAQAVAATVIEAAPEAKVAVATPSGNSAPVKAAAPVKTAAPAKTPAAKATTKAAPAKAGSASTILLDAIRRVGEAAAEAKARVAPAVAAVASVVSAPAPVRSEPEKDAAPQPAATPASAPASAAPVAAPLRPPFGSGRPGFPGGDSRLHQLQPRPVAKPTGPRPGFKLEEFIVYPAHGVGQIVGIEEQEVAGFKLELYVISFAKDKMTLKVPTPKVVSVGMRKLAEPALVQKALEVLTGRARIKRTMWSRRAQEYEAKINSGDIIAIAEVIRDLYRSEAQPEQSYSERQLYEAALDRMAREIGAVEKLTETETLKLIETQLQKGPRRGVKPEGESEGEGEAEPEGEVEEAAA